MILLISKMMRLRVQEAVCFTTADSGILTPKASFSCRLELTPGTTFGKALPGARLCGLLNLLFRTFLGKVF